MIRVHMPYAGVRQEEGGGTLHRLTKAAEHGDAQAARALGAYRAGAKISMTWSPGGELRAVSVVDEDTTRRASSPRSRSKRSCWLPSATRARWVLP